MLQMLAKYNAHSGKAAWALIINTTTSMERSALAHIAPHMPNVFAIGPLHAACESSSRQHRPAAYRETP